MSSDNKLAAKIV